MTPVARHTAPSLSGPERIMSGSWDRWVVLLRREHPSAEAVATFGLGSVPIVALGFADGGFYPRPWGWAALGLAVTAVVFAVARHELLVSRRSLLLLALLCSLGLWIAASLVWTRSVGAGVFELQRLLVYLTGVGAAALLIRPHTARTLVMGVFVGTSIAAVWGLVSYLLNRERATDVFQGSFLHSPMGYANAMAIVSVIAGVLALGIFSDSASRLERTGAGVALVPLASALTLTGSRAAWGALLVGAAITVALMPTRTRTITAWAGILLVPAAAVLLLSTTDLTSSRITGASADRLGDRLLATVVALTALAVVPALIVVSRPVGNVRRALGERLGVALVVAVLGGILLGLAVRAPDLAGDRPTFWRVAIDEFGERPLLGSGAGTYAQVWLERRPVEASVRDAHSIVVEALSELGVVGLFLVLILLGAPLVWGIRSRHRPLVPAATGAFGAYVAHASVDWDWEMPAITLAALFCAVALAVTADGERRRHALGATRRATVVAAGTVAACVALAGFVGASAMENASRALVRGDMRSADHAARRAERWQPWSVEPLLVRGRVALSLGDRGAARVLFAQAARREPNDYRVWLALAAATDGDTATSAVLRARELNPRAVRGLSAS